MKSLLAVTAFLLCALVCFPFSFAAASVAVTDAKINQTISVQTPTLPLNEQASPKKLWTKYGKSYSPNFYVQVYRFTVTPGQKFTLYGYFPPDGQYRNLYITGENPLTDFTGALDSKGDMTGFVFWAQQPSKWQCAAVTRRVNLEISPRSEHNYLYAVAVSQKPGLGFKMQLKTPADPDQDVERNTQDPSCPPIKGFTWGQTWSRPLILLLDPTEKEKTTAVKPAPTKPLDVTDLPLNQTAVLQSPAAPLDQSSSPKKLWAKYGKDYSPNFFVRIYRFTVDPGQKYTLYGIFPPDETYRNFYISGENPLTDYTSSFGDTQNVTTGFVFWAQQPGKWQCSGVTRRINLTISPRSEHHYLYLIAVTKQPNLSFSVMLKSPADSDTDVDKSIQDPNCPPKKGFTWGQVWGTPVLLRYDPSEK
jgi:hypothetical protein